MSEEAKCSCWADGFAGFNANPNCSVHAIPNSVAESAELIGITPASASQYPDATRNRVPTEAELAEVMAACWDNPGFRSNRDANGYPKMAKALRSYLLRRAT